MHIYRIENIKLKPLLVIARNHDDAARVLEYAFVTGMGNRPDADFDIVYVDPDKMERSKRKNGKLENAQIRSKEIDRALRRYGGTGRRSLCRRGFAHVAICAGRQSSQSRGKTYGSGEDQSGNRYECGAFMRSVRH